MHALAEKTPEVAFCLPKEGVEAPIDINLPWYVLQVAHGREVMACEAIDVVLSGDPEAVARAMGAAVPVEIDAAEVEAWLRQNAGGWQVEPEPRVRRAPTVSTRRLQCGQPKAHRKAWAPDEYRYVRASRHCKGRTRPVKARLLPGYVLASVASIGEWRRVRGLETARGERLVWGAILSDGRPAQVPRADMEGLLRLAGAVRPYVTSGEARRRLAAAAEERQRTGSGGMARVHRGVWAGSDVPIAAVTGVDRVRALLPMLGSLRLVEMRVSDFVEDGDEA